MSAFDSSVVDLVHATCPGRYDRVAFLHAYLDESSGGEFLTVGGFVFRKSKVRPFERKWGQMLKKYGLPYFRMSACNYGSAPFDKMSDIDRDQCGREAVSIISEHAMHSFYCGVKLDEFNEVFGEKGPFLSPYSFCAYMCAVGLGAYYGLCSGEYLISYFFEAGDAAQKNANVVLSNMCNAPNGRELLKYRSHTFIGKTDSKPTQAADWMAWQSNKHLRRCLNGAVKPRGDYAALLIRVPCTYLHATKPWLQSAYDGIIKVSGSEFGNKLARLMINSQDPSALSQSECAEILKPSC